MAARAADRRHTRQVELALEARVTGDEIDDIVTRLKTSNRRVATFLKAIVEAHNEREALLALLDARADHVVEVSAELAGLLEDARPTPPAGKSADRVARAPAPLLLLQGSDAEASATTRSNGEQAPASDVRLHDGLTTEPQAQVRVPVGAA